MISTDMPAQIAALPRTAAGIPVTWGAAWSSELDVEVRPEPLLNDTLAYFTGGRQGLGDPHVSYPHPGRVRICAVKGICQVCGLATKPESRWLCDLRLGQEVFRYRNSLVPLLIDSWTCDDCIDYSLRNCPNLSRRPAIDVLRVSDWILVPTLERPKWFSDEIPYGPVGFIKIAVIEYEKFTVHPPLLTTKKAFHR